MWLFLIFTQGRLCIQDSPFAIALSPADSGHSAVEWRGNSMAVCTFPTQTRQTLSAAQIERIEKCLPLSEL
jgi:hypothetical protein